MMSLMISITDGGKRFLIQKNMAQSHNLWMLKVANMIESLRLLVSHGWITMHRPTMTNSEDNQKMTTRMIDTFQDGVKILV